MVGWHHQLSGHEFEQTSGGSEGQGSLVCCSPWGRKELDTTEQLNWTELRHVGGSKPDHRYKLMKVFTSEVCGRSVGFKDMYSLEQDRLDQWLSKCDSWVAALISPGNLLEMQILELFPTDLWIRNSGGGSQQIVFQQPFTQSWCRLKFENHWVRLSSALRY